ncbi:MAG: group 1 truncated hemoglobin [Rickettsiales bacterium]
MNFINQIPMSSLYERIGGENAVDAAVEIFYYKVLNDNRVNHFFKNIHISRLMAKQKAFITFAFGGPSKYTYWQRGLRNSHRESVKNGMNDTHFDMVLKHLTDSLKEMMYPEEIIDEVREIVEGTRKHVLDK